MMISSDELRALAERREEGPHVSVFMPTARAGAEIQQGPIRFKNLLNVEKRAIDLEDAADANPEDLLDLAAVQTYLNGGTVYVVEPKEVPGGDISAAVFRY